MVQAKGFIIPKTVLWSALLLLLGGGFAWAKDWIEWRSQAQIRLEKVEGALTSLDGKMDGLTEYSKDNGRKLDVILRREGR